MALCALVALARRPHVEREACLSLCSLLSLSHLRAANTPRLRGEERQSWWLRAWEGLGEYLSVVLVERIEAGAGEAEKAKKAHHLYTVYS